MQFSHGAREKQEEDASGAVLVEFAIILPLLAFLTFGIIEVSMLFNAHSNVVSSTRAGGRAGAISSLDPQMQFKAAQAAAGALNVSQASVQGTPQVCVGKYNASSANPCGDFAMTADIVHTGAPDDPTWQIQVPGFAPGALPPADNWPVANRNYGCGGAQFDRVVVVVFVNKELVVPSLFGPLLGGDAPTVKSTSTFQLEPVPVSACP